MPAVDAAIWSMCVSEMAVWNARHVSYEAALSEYEYLNSTYHHIFLFEINGGHVAIREKPEFYTSDQFEADLKTAFHSIPPWLRAAIMYRNLLSIVAETLCPDLDTIIAVDVGDLGMHSEIAPLFGISKTVGYESVLLPHFEFIWDDYHENIIDDIPYSEKSVSAMFAGSTTGMEPITVEAVRQLLVPRIRSAVFFKDHPMVDFRLPHIVQCTADAERLLRDMGFGTGLCPFEDHFVHKFIISIDGNAGSCSRTSIALKSNCALLKYASSYIMHYSSHLIPWFHYIPIHSDQDVNSIIDMERRFPGFFEFIAIEGQKFFDSYICKQQIINYTGALLRMYAESFDYSSPGGHRLDSGSSPQAGPRAAPLVRTPSMISRSDVIEAYRAVLGRDPESEEVIQSHAAIRSIPELYRILVESEEFREVFTDEAPEPEVPGPYQPLDWPPIDVQSRASDAAQLTALFARVRITWSRLGQQDPYFSVCTDPRLLGPEIGEDGKAEFYASGRNELRLLNGFAGRSGIDLAGRVCLELGCGLGRVTRFLAPAFRRVHAVDVSPGHLAIAERELAGAGIENVSLTQISSPEDLRQIVGYDAFFSTLVLQHNPPPLIAYILMQVLTNLNAGGVALFQVPTYQLDYSFSVDEYLNTPVPEEPEIEMHVLPQRDVMRIVHATGCRLLELREDGSTGIRDGISNTFFVQKAT